MLMRLLYLLIIFFCGYNMSKAKTNYDKLSIITVVIISTIIELLLQYDYI